MQFLYLYLLSIPVFVALDLLWVGVVAKSFYQSRLGYILGPINWFAAAAFYLIFLLGLTFFATFPAYSGGTVWYAVILGTLFGLFTYGTQSLVNLTAIKGWPLFISIVDTVRGAAFGAVVASIVFLIAQLLF